MKTFFYSLVVLAFLLLPVSMAKAEGPTPETQAWTGEVSGNVMNKTTGRPVDHEVEVMLHGWDQNYAEKLMLHGNSAADGSFLFKDVAFEPGVRYAVMASFAETAYYSEPFQPEPEQSAVSLDVSVFETTSDLSTASIPQMHVLFYWDQGGLSVSEVYILSNSGNRTIMGAEQLEDGSPVTLKFALPEGAANLSFGHSSGSRFLQFPGGYADTQPLQPGHSNSQVMVSYVLPYQDGMPFDVTAPLGVENLSILVPQDAGLTVSGEGLAPEGEYPMQNGQKFSVYSRSQLATGESVRLTLAGEPAGPALQGAEAGAPSLAEKPDLKVSLGLGGAALGLALVIAGIWWSRRPLPQSPRVQVEGNLNALLSEIAVLDQANEEGKLPAEEYSRRRSALVAHAQAAIQAQENPE